VGAVRGVLRDGVWHVGRLMVAPDLQGRGLGRRLLAAVEVAAPPEVTSYELFTGAGSKRNQKMYKKAGYRLAGSPGPGVVSMVKPRIRTEP
jgi:tRNA (guanine37-N1)-methyltransferase